MNSKLKIGTTEKVYCYKYGFKKGLSLMKSHGFDGMDYQEFVNTDTPLFEKSQSEFIAYLNNQRKLIEDSGIFVHQTHGPWRWPVMDATESDRQERFEKMSRSIEGTAVLGCKNMIIHPIMPYEINDSGHEQETYEINLDFVSRLAKVGQKFDVVICFENMPMRNLSLGSIEAAFKFVKDINHDYCKVCLDAGHCIICGTEPADAVRMLGKEYLYGLHIHDNDGQYDKHWAPYHGVIDWNAFGHALREIQFDGVISLEADIPGKLPDKLREDEEIGQYRKARYIAMLAAKHIMPNH